jgi:Zn ribbon nucleic-acid-binding protein
MKCPRCQGEAWKTRLDNRNAIEVKTCHGCGFQRAKRVQMTIGQGAEFERRRLDSLFSGMKANRGGSKYWGSFE